MIQLKEYSLTDDDRDDNDERRIAMNDTVRRLVVMTMKVTKDVREQYDE